MTLSDMSKPDRRGMRSALRLRLSSTMHQDAARAENHCRKMRWHQESAAPATGGAAILSKLA